MFKKYGPLDMWGKYNPVKVAKFSVEEFELYYIAKPPGMNIVFLKHDNGNDWYLWLKALSPETLKISFYPGWKEIVHFFMMLAQFSRLIRLLLKSKPIMYLMSLPSLAKKH